MSTLRQPAIFREPQTIYDSPELLGSMFLDNEVTMDGIRAAVFDQSALTAKEREGFATRLKQAAGNAKLSNAMIDVATNPFVWFYFLTTPVGGSALARGSSSIWASTGRRASAFFKKDGAWFAGFQTAQQVLENTATGAITRQVGSRMQALQEDFGRRLGPAMERLFQQQGISRLDWQRISNPVEREKARELSDILLAHRRRLHEDTAETMVSVEKGLPVVVEGQRSAWFPGADLDHAVDRLGLREVTDITDQFFKDRSRILFEETDRLRRSFNIVRNRVIGGADLKDTTAEGAEIIRAILGPMSEGLSIGSITEKQFVDFLDTTVNSLVKNNANVYFPRNVFDDMLNGQSLSPDVFGLKGNNPASGVRISNALYHREAHEIVTHPDDLMHMAATVAKYAPGGGTSDSFAKAVKQGSHVLRKAVGDTPQRLQRFNWVEGLAKYHDSTARTIALTDPPSAEVLAVNKRVRDELRPSVFAPDNVGGAGYSSIKNAQRETLGDAADNVAESLSDSIARGVAPPGGFSVADAMEAEWKLLSGNGYAQRVLSDIVAPSIAGIATSKGVGTMHSLLKAKNTMLAVVGRTPEEMSPVATAIVGLGHRGEEFVEQLRNWSLGKTDLQQARMYTRAVAGTLYVGHLGINAGSVALNLMQPLIMGPMLLGHGPVLGAYTNSLKELFGYMDDRIRTYGLKPIHSHERNDLIRKHFKFAGVQRSDGTLEDMIGITKGPFEILDDTLTMGTSGIIGREGPLKAMLFEYPMKMFEKAEWLNRNVMAHAVEGAYRKAGRGGEVGGALFFEDVARTVQETQFGSGVLNTPILFQSTGRGADLTLSGRMFANPLMRQFLTFQLRSFTSPFFASGRLAEGTRQILGQEINLGRGAPFFDIMRGIGFSSLIYEIGKNALGEDLSSGLYVGAGTEIIPGIRGGRFDVNEDIIPVPPIVDIAFNTAKGIVGGDYDLVEQQLTRFIPGGVAISKASNLLPSGVPTPLIAQRTTVDWQNSTVDEEGRTVVPVYDRDGRLLDYRSPFDMVVESTGMRFSRPTLEAEKAMIRNRDQAVELRRKATHALILGDNRTYQAATMEFQKRFGIPMQIGADTLRQARRSMNETRPQRIFKNMPQDIRSQFDSRTSDQGNPDVGVLPEEPQG